MPFVARGVVVVAASYNARGKAAPILELLNGADDCWTDGVCVLGGGIAPRNCISKPPSRAADGRRGHWRRRIIALFGFRLPIFVVFNPSKRIPSPPALVPPRRRREIDLLLSFDVRRGTAEPRGPAGGACLSQPHKVTSSARVSPPFRPFSFSHCHVPPPAAAIAICLSYVAVILSAERLLLASSFGRRGRGQSSLPPSLLSLGRRRCRRAGECVRVISNRHYPRPLFSSINASAQACLVRWIDGSEVGWMVGRIGR